MKKMNCPSCNTDLESAFNAENMTEKPFSGAVTMCFHCGHLMAFADDLSLRELTDSEMVEVAGDPAILKAQRARGIIQAARERAEREKAHAPKVPVEDAWMVLAVHPGGGEGLCAIEGDNGFALPMVATTSRVRDMLFKGIKDNGLPGKFRLVRFKRIEVEGEFENAET
jgi:RNase P subunit RPR2